MITWELLECVFLPLVLLFFSRLKYILKFLKIYTCQSHDPHHKHHCLEGFSQWFSSVLVFITLQNPHEEVIKYQVVSFYIITSDRSSLPHRWDTVFLLCVSVSVSYSSDCGDLFTQSHCGTYVELWGTIYSSP